MIRTVSPAEPLLADLDRWVRRQIDGELNRLARRAPQLPDAVAQELGSTLARLGERLVLSPTRTWTTRYPDRHEELAALFAAAPRDRRNPSREGIPR